MGVCFWFVVPGCIAFGVSTVRGSAVQCVFQWDCWPSVTAVFCLAGSDTSCLTCSKHSVWNTPLFLVCGFVFRI